MKVYRITATEFASDLDGKGSARRDNRWNRKGTHVVYTSETISNAVLENLVHNPELSPMSHSLVTIEIPDDLIVSVEDFPYNPHFYIQNAVQIGDDIINGKNVHILSVPSVIVPHERNYILNSKFKEYFKIVSSELFMFDTRLELERIRQGLHKKAEIRK